MRWVLAKMSKWILMGLAMLAVWWLRRVLRRRENAVRRQEGSVPPSSSAQSVAEGRSADAEVIEACACCGVCVPRSEIIGRLPDGRGFCSPACQQQGRHR